QQADIEKTIHAIDLVDQQLGGSLQTTEKWSALKDSWWDLKGRTFQLSLAENAGAHEQLMGAIASLIKTAGDSSNLILDPDLDSYYLMSNVVVLLPDILERLGKARDFAVQVQTGSLSAADLRELTILNGQIESDLQNVRRGMSVAMLSNP